MRDRSLIQSLIGLPTYLTKSIILFTAGGITVLLFLILLGVWRAGGRFGAIVEVVRLLTPSNSEPQIDVPTLIVEQLSDASELTTAVFAMETVVPASQERKLGDFAIGTTKLLYVAYGEVRVGVDLNQLQPDDIRPIDGTVQIQLPPPKVLDSKIDVHRSQVYDYDRGFLGLGPDVAPQLHALAQKKGLDQITATACSQGVLETANERAEVTVKTLLATAGYNNVEVKTASPDVESCAPDRDLAVRQ